MNKTDAQLAYEKDLELIPNYEDGSPRKSWDKLGLVEKNTWIKNPHPEIRTGDFPPLETLAWESTAHNSVLVWLRGNVLTDEESEIATPDVVPNNIKLVA